MRLKLLLLLLLVSGGLFAQEANRSLVFTEARLNSASDTYAELTNMGSTPINLSEYKFGKISPWSEAIHDVYVDPWNPGSEWFFFPEVILQPGQSYVITTAYDFGPEQYRKRVTGFEGNRVQKQEGMYEVADLLIHMSEPKGDATDSITTSVGGRGNGSGIRDAITVWHGRSAFFVEHHLSETDSVVVDQVNGVFDNDGHNQGWPDSPGAGYDVAGVSMGGRTHILVRKFSVKTGNLDFANARGVGLDDSEWMPIPQPGSNNRDIYWTVGNHGAYNLDENTLVSDVIDVDFANKTLTVPWGVRRGDGIMHQMEKKPGVAWEYIVSPDPEDSLSFAAHTGDQITIYVCGNDLDVETFDIVVSEPTADVNIVVPKPNVDPTGYWRDNIEDGYVGWPWVSQNESGIDTITGTWYGLPYATRIDSLVERLDFPSNATYEFEFVDGVTRPDLKDGDILRVTAQNGETKDYHIQVQPYEPNHNAYLSAITWPDIPEYYKGIFGWAGDTIPNFNPTTYNYRVQVPFDVDGIPALIAKTQALNATVEVKRATSLTGTPEQRTVEFTVTAEDDSVTHTYSIELIKEKDMDKIQPYAAEPFLSEFVFWEQWSNSFAEIMNPGNLPLDLSNYMFAMDWINSPADMIGSGGGEDEWLDRYDKYVPGYKWVDEATWAVKPAYLEQDLNVNPIVQPGDVFVMGGIWTTAHMKPGWLPDYVWPVPAQLDVQFNNHYGQLTLLNPWGEDISNNGSPVRKWSNANWYMFKILNDSIKLGLKPATDPNDFELVEVFGMGESTDWIIGGTKANMISNYMRKPEVYTPKPGFTESFGDTPENSEWTWTNRAYWQKRNVGWPMEILNIGNDLGQHFMHTPTHYMSTVSSIVYKVSDGYSMNEEIRGPQLSTTVAEFLGNIVKANENQSLKVVSGADGSVMADDALLNMNDTLVVVSADSTNTTKYRLDVTEEGLDNNAVLTSDRYKIEIIDNPVAAAEGAADEHNTGTGIISGFEYGTQLKTVVENINVPQGASLTVIDENGAYVPQTRLNFDTSYVFVTVNHNMFFEVVAEDGVTTIIYQLTPQADETSAFVTSDIYNVDQRDLLIEFVPRGTAVATFLSNVTPSLGASITLVDKLGNVRTDGQIYQDDRVVVTSANGEAQTVYYLSMLRSEYLREPGIYLAYITSNVYTVDQQELKVMLPQTGVALSTFYNRITPASGATAVIVDANGNEKTSGNIESGDKVKVTSANGEVVVMYAITATTSSRFDNDASISLYPNPTTGKVNISGVVAGAKIKVFNSTGANIMDLKVQRSIETISLDEQPAGMYLIVISGENQTLGSYKVLKR